MTILVRVKVKIKKLAYKFYRVYAELHTRLITDQDLTPIPAVPCQFCGGIDHDEAGCPRAEAFRRRS